MDKYLKAFRMLDSWMTEILERYIKLIERRWNPIVDEDKMT